MGVIVSTNPIHSVIFLILVFFNATGLLIVLTPKTEFIAVMFLIIYVGAIAVLFLFVVMMLNVRDADTNWSRYFVPVALVNLLFLLG
jgi:NADH-quinone oxidoreductase subunit J